jgi:hypothetical protein
MRGTFFELALVLGPGVAVAIAGAVLAYREARRRGAPRGQLVASALGAVLRGGLVCCGVLAAAVIALKVAAASDHAPFALLAAPWIFAAGGTFGLLRWRGAVAVRRARP